MENCKALSATLPGRVFFSGSLEYNESRSYFTAFENELSPACVVRPSSADDVATIIKIVSSSALSGKIKLAVRSGGHTPWPGAANVNEGITIDLRNITGVRVDSQTNVVSIGAGERWRNIYEQLDHQGLAVVGGRVANAGIAGLTTGGTISNPHNCGTSFR